MITNLKLTGLKLEPVQLETWNNLIKNIDESNSLFKFSPLYLLNKPKKKEIVYNLCNANVLKYLNKLDAAYPIVSIEEIVKGLIINTNSKSIDYK